MKILTLLCLLVAVANSVSAAETPQPNIVYLLVDDLGWSDCGFMGCEDIRTPPIDALAGQGAILKSFYVQPVCSPTRASLMTGRYATHTGVYTIVRPNAAWGLPLNERTPPQALQDTGYATAICGKWHLGEFQPDYTPTRRGFDQQYGHMFGAIDYFTHQRDGKNDWYRNDEPAPEDGYSKHLIAKEACRVIRDKPNDKPLFLYVPFLKRQRRSESRQGHCKCTAACRKGHDLRRWPARSPHGPVTFPPVWRSMSLCMASIGIPHCSSW